MTISEYLKYAELAQAAYANLTIGTFSDVDLESLRDAADMTTTQSQTFADNWTVIDQYDGMVEETYVDEFGDEQTFLNPTGLSVTLFVDDDGKQVVAIRGTDDLDDIVTDVVDIGVLGTSKYQAQYKALSVQVQKWMDDGDLQSGFSVTGHSLGGFLATNLTLEYSADVTHTYIYNAPGMEGVVDGVIEAIADALSPDNEFTIPAVLPISNIVATDDVVSLVGLSIAPPIVVTVDAQSFLTAHSIVGLTESLAVYNLFSTISGSNNIDDFTPFLEKSSDERVLSAVNKIFQAGIDTSQVPVDLAMELSEYVVDHSLTGFTVTSLCDQSASELQAAAENDIAALFSLNELVDFTISGNQPGYTGLDIADYSDQYLEDRAKFLYATTHDNPDSIRYEQRGENGADGFEIPDNQQSSSPSNYIFGTKEHDAIMGDQNEDHLYGMGGNDTLSGQGGDDYIEGGKGQDTMDGGTGQDTFLIAGTDDDYDIFYGGSGEYNDRIFGSTGNDTIRVHDFSGDNSIEIIDGNGGDTDIIAGTTMDDTIDLSGTQLIGIERIEGGGGQDTITGSAGDDTIYGGTREAIEDNVQDRLEGGSGNDIYHIGNGDIINDSDQQGTVRLNGEQLSNLTLTQVGANSDIYKNDGYLAQLDRNTGSLIVHDRTGNLSFTIENFTSGSFGITLQDYTAPQDNFDGTLTGTSEHDEMSIINLGSDQTNWELAYTSFQDGVTSNTPFYTTPLPATAPHLSVTGGDSGDFLFGFQSYDHIDGGSGNDVIMGYLGYWGGVELTMTGPLEGDLIEGGSGNDWIQGSGGDDQLFGGANNDIIQGYDGEDYLSGDDGNDILAGGAYDAIMEGGDGDDALFGDGYYTGSMAVSTDNIDNFALTFDYVEEGFAIGYTPVNFNIYNDAQNPGNDVLSGGLGRDWLEGGIGNDILDGGDDSDSLFGGIGNDNLKGGAGNDWLVGDNGNLTGDGNDVLSGGSGDDVIYGLGGVDVLYGDEGNDQLFGDEGADILNGGDEDDYLAGGGGNDTLIGGRGTDLLEGGADIDRYVLSEGDDTTRVIDSGENIIEFTSVFSLEELSVSYATITGDTATLDQNGNSLWIEYGSGDLAIIENGRINDALQFTLADGSIYSTADIVDTVADTIQGTDGDDTIYSGGGDDTLYGNDGNDQLFGEEGDDILYSGSGIDSLYGGTGDDLLYGESGDNLLVGGSDNDILTSRNGNDVLIGGTGNDEFRIYGGGHDVIDDTEGQSLVRLTSTYTQLRYIAYVDEQIVENPEGPDLLIVFDEENTLVVRGGRNADLPFIYLFGTQEISHASLLNEVNEEITGTNGNDTIDAGGGDDSVNAGAGADTVYGGSGDDLLHGGVGDDVLWGEAGNDTLYGDEGDDELNGGEGNDVLSGGAGNDTLYVSDWRYEYLNNTSYLIPDEPRFDGGEGDGDNLDLSSAFDKIISEQLSIDYVSVDLESGEFPDIENIHGSEFNDLLSGNAAANTLLGSDGDDILRGGGGSDILDGGEGNDEVDYSYSAEGVIVSLQTGTAEGGDAQGDILQNIESLVGSNYSDLLAGNELDNSLEGGAGDDTLVGREGNDILSGGDGTNILLGGNGDDTLSAGGSYSKAYGGDGSDYLSDPGDGGELYGEGGDDHLYLSGSVKAFADGGIGDDFLESWIAHSEVKMLGGDGDDLLVTHQLIASSVFASPTIMNGGAGNDYLHSLKSDTLVGEEGDDLLVNQYAPGLLYGGSGNDILFCQEYRNFSGHVLEDHLTGGTGNDLLQGGWSNDHYHFYSGDGDDIIYDESEANTIHFAGAISVSDLQLNTVSFLNEISTTTYYPDFAGGSPAYYYTLLDNDISEVYEDPQGDSLRIHYGPTDSITFAVAGAEENCSYVFGNGDTYSYQELLAAMENNHAPVVSGPVDLGAMLEDGSLSVSVETLLGQATDADGDSLVIDNLTVDTGTLEDNGDGVWMYQPDADTNGPVFFQYQISDGQEAVTATAILEVEAVNDVPVLTTENATYQLFGVSGQEGNVVASDVDGDPLFYEVATAPEHGQLTVAEDGRWLYQAEPDYCGPDQAILAVSDGAGGTASITLDFIVNVYPGGDFVLGVDAPESLLLDGIGIDALSLSRQGDDLLIAIADQGSLTVTDYFVATQSGIKRLQTEDGLLRLDRDAIQQSHDGWLPLETFVGNDADKDLLVGSWRVDIMTGEGNDDVFWFSVNWRIHPFELVYNNGGIHHAQKTKKLHRPGEGLHSQTAPG